jgi:mRNA interferase HicA
VQEFKRWLAKQGATFAPAKGSHFRVYLNGKQSILPMHAKEIKTGTVDRFQSPLALLRNLHGGVFSMKNAT